MAVFDGVIPAIVGAANAAGGGYEIERSLRFNSADSAHLDRTPSSAGNRRTWTWSGWVKRTALGADKFIFSAGSDPSNFHYLRFQSNNTLEATEKISDSVQSSLITSAVFRDPSAWHHIIYVYDSTQAIAADRLSLYVNGVKITSFSTSTYPSQNHDSYINSTSNHIINGRPPATYSDFYLAEIHSLDGTAVSDASDFGEYDSNNVWQPKEVSGVTYGTNGYYLDFSDNSSSAALGTDSSGNGNDWTVNNLSVAAGPLSSSRGTNYDDDSATYTEYGTVSQATGQTLPMSNPSHYEGAAMRVNSGGFKVVTTNSATTDFFMACWVKFDSLANGYQMGVDLQGSYKYFEARSGGAVLVRHIGGAATSSSSGTLSTNTWIHIALSRSGGTLRAFVNGTIACSTTAGVTGDSISANEEFNFFGQSGTFYNIPGYLLDPVVYIGAGRSTNYTTPTAPLLTSAGAINDVAGMSSSNRYYASPLISVGPGAEAIDSLIDTPTNYEADSGNNGGNYCVMNPLDNGQGTQPTFSNGNLETENTGTNVTWTSCRGTIGIKSGKYYFEWTNRYAGGGLYGIANAVASANPVGTGTGGWTWGGANRYFNGSSGGTGLSNHAVGDVIQIAFDADTGKLWFGRNGTFYDSSWGTTGDPGAGTNNTTSVATGVDYFPALANLGSSGQSNADPSAFNAGQRPFAYTPPTGFLSLCTTNLPNPTIADGSTAMDVVLYTGDGNSTQTITGLNFAPDLTWQKIRNLAGPHALTDSVRGVSAGYLRSHSTAAETGSSANGVSAFTSDGFTAAGAFNTSSNNWVTWAWDAGTSTVSNTDGSITSSVRASQTNGCSIVSYSGNLTTTGSETIGHGLNAAPAMIISKSRTLTGADTGEWAIQHSSLTATHILRFDTAASSAKSGLSAPTSSVFTTTYTVGLNTDGNDYIAYCFAPVEGYSAFGSYTGNGSTDGPFVYTGFRPRWVMIKTSSSTASWLLWDTARSPYNTLINMLVPNTTAAEDTSNTNYEFDMFSNGFQPRGTTQSNTSGVTYIYAAFAEHPFKTARAR